MGIFRYAYRDDCNQADDEAMSTPTLERYIHRLEDPESKTVLKDEHVADKLIIRPLRVERFYMHFLQTTRNGFDDMTINTNRSFIFFEAPEDVRRGL